ncbi:hypothetical protein CPB84DRAFT_1749860 [Gymnopilus junonius]|uniref:Uncharacterized protein n=1 Tax=Gymnopilus junonius TaxID=109634 RepID=A0A9P5NID1_GYMJU|nr:hypothetical protein CPB84DRAFT_1749860 [Gymnopilus junonius]
MEALISGLIDIGTGLITQLTNLITVQHTTNQTLLAHTQAQPTVNVNTSASIKPEQPRNYDGNPNCVTAFIQELRAYFYMANVMDIQKQIFFAISKIHGGRNDIATAWSDAIRNNIMERNDEIAWITILSNTSDYSTLRMKPSMPSKHCNKET